MATRVLTDYPEEGMVRARWDALTAAETGDAASIGHWPNKTVQGTGGTYSVEGSNDGVNWGALSDLADGAALTTVAANEVHAISENPRFIRAVSVTATSVIIIGV